MWCDGLSDWLCMSTGQFCQVNLDDGCYKFEDCFVNFLILSAVMDCC